MRRRLGTVLAAAGVLLTVASGTPAVAAASNDQLVQAWYRVYLERSAQDAAADAGRNYWVGRLAAGESREAVLDDILVSREYVTLEVADYYARFLGRGLDAGAQYWVDGVVEDRFVAEWAAQLIVNSDEYYRTWTAGSRDADAAWVRSLYFDLLQRSASDGDVAYWRGVLQREGRFAVVRGIWYADEGVRVRVDRNYRTVLGRPVDDGAFGYWAPIEVRSDHVVRYRLGATEEFARVRAS